MGTERLNTFEELVHEVSRRTLVSPELVRKILREVPRVMLDFVFERGGAVYKGLLSIRIGKRRYMGQEYYTLRVRRSGALKRAFRRMMEERQGEE